MKILTFLFIACACSLMAAEYMNVETGSGRRYAELSNLSKITFNEAGTEINFVMSGSTTTVTIADIVKIEFGELQEGDIPLPVELLRFTATRQAGQVFLYWETASETENLGFDVERKQNNESSWEKLSFVQGKGSTSALSAYRFTDKNCPDPAASRYRLKQMDYSGLFEYSPEITFADENIISTNTFRLLPNFPNPFNPETTISYELTEKNLTTLSIYNLQGREMTQLVNKAQDAGLYQVSFDGGAFSSGVYICRLVSGADTKIIKMLLLR